jgi:bla regulator protein BlaR1
MILIDWAPLVNHVWQSTALIGVAALVARALRRNSARVRYWVWFAASLKFLVPFSALVGIGGLVEWRQASELVRQPFTPILVDIGGALARPIASIPAAYWLPLYVPALLVSVWLGGALVGAIGWLRAWLRFRAVLRTSSPLSLPLPPSLQIRTLSTPLLLEPGIVGILRPVLLLPRGITDRLTPEQLQAIVAHEICHVRRRDNLTSAIHMVVETLFWWHPAVWWLRTRLIAERERACDEQVLRELGEPQAYAEGILNVCRFYHESPLACAAGVTGSHLQTRIEAIMANANVRDVGRGQKLLLAAVGIVAVATPLGIGAVNASPRRAQSPAAESARFDAASIKPSALSAVAGSGFQITQGHLLARNTTVEDLVRFAYGLEPGDRESISGGPRWARSDRFQVEGKAEGKATPDALRAMLRSLLADRFRLRLHEETKELPVYALSLAGNGGKTGPNLKPTAADESAHCASLEADPPAAPEFGADGTKRCAASFRGGLKLRGRPIGDLAEMLHELVGRAVIDRTGLSGRFDADLDAALDWDHLVGGAPSDLLGRNAVIFTALPEQLGLKLEPSRGAVRTIVIDSVEKPTEN